MEYLKSKNFLEDKLNSLKKYTTYQEKEALLLEDDASFSETVAILSDITPINELEAVAMIFKLREISVSDIIELTQTCPHCNYPDIHQIEIKEFFNFKSTLDIPIGLFENIDDIINTSYTNDLILSEYIRIEEELEQQNTKVFRPYVFKYCKRCSSQLKFDVHPKSIISKSGPSNIFKEYMNLTFYSSMNKKDVDDMFPYEREIFLNLLKEKLKENPLGGLPK